MSAEEGIQIQIQAEDEFSEAFDSAQQSLNEFSNSVTATQENVTSATDEMSESVQSSTASFQENMSSVMGVSGAMMMGVGSVVGLGDAYTRQEEANLRLQNAQDNLTKAQNAYNMAVEKYGPNSVQAQNALLALQNAQNNLATAQDRAKLSGEQVDMQLLNMATMTIPMMLAKGPELLTFLGLMEGEEGALTASQLAQSAASGIATGAMALFDAVMDANPVVLVVLAIGGLVAALAYLTDGFKNFGPLQEDFAIAWKDVHTALEDVVGFVRSDVDPVLDELYKIYVQPIITAINDIEGIGSKISGGLSTLGKDIGIPGLAEGGIVTTPTLAMIGEDGPEAVLPLSDASLSAPQGLLPLPQITTTNASNTTTSTKTQTINIQNDMKISSDVDGDALIQKMVSQIASKVDRGS